MADQGISVYLQQQIQEYQQDEDSSRHSAVAKAKSIRKHVALLALNGSVSRLSLKSKRTNESESENEILTSILLQYVDTCMAAEGGNDIKDQVERIFDLVSALAAVHSEEATEAVAARAMEFSTSIVERVRSQACQLMGLLVFHLSGKKDEWAEEWFEALKDALTSRLTDKSQAVRNSAIQATGNFFHGENDTEDLLECLLWSVWHDPSVANRGTALDALPISEITVDHIITRLRDVKEKVRVQALDVLRTKVDPATDLSTEQFTEIVRCGLSVRCDVTEAATKKLICSKWMKAAKFNPVELLKMMDTMTNEEDCERVMEFVLKTAHLGDKTILNELSAPEIRSYKSTVEKSFVQLSDPSLNISPEEIFLARIACSTATASEEYNAFQKEEIISKIAPDVPVLCELFQRELLTLIKAQQEGSGQLEDEKCFICLQLLQIAKLAGLNEEGSRRHFSSVIKGVLASGETPEDLIEGCVGSLRAAHGSENEFFGTVFEIVSDLLGGGTENVYHLDPSVMLRILSITSIVLETTTSSISSHPLYDTFSEIINSAVANPNGLVREAAVSCLGKIGLFSEASAVQGEYKPVLLRLANDESEKLEIRSQALLGLSDWSFMYSEILQPCEVDGVIMSFLDTVLAIMENSNVSVTAIAAEVAAKLLFSGRVCESTVIARLLVIFFDPNQDEDTDMSNQEVGSPIRLQQLLSIFFPAYSIKSEHGRVAMLGSISTALDLAVNQRVSKGKKRKLVFPIVKMIEFVCSTVVLAEETAAGSDGSGAPSTPRNCPEEETTKTSAGTLAAIQVAEFLVSECSLTMAQTRALCKFIGAQELGLNDEKVHLKKLKEQTEELGMIITDATSLRSLALLNEQLVEFDVEDDLSEDDPAQDDGNDSDATETEDEGGDDRSTGESTLDDSLMENMANVRLSSGKENSARLSRSKRLSGRSFQSRRSDASASVLSSVGNY